ncbi:hypothetical protein [Microbacterium sp. NPDC076911]|uniref:hypothetical protein n=1 Tax=Microbacterium sp. NPDC076911 TaxID=3154958 RepID=UPI00344385F6
MGEIFHVGALVPAAIGTCCIAADRRWVRAPELLASLIMLTAMLDVMFWSLIAPVFWSAALIAFALLMVAARGLGRGARSEPGSARMMGAHSALGMVVMAVIVMAMAPAGSSVDLPAGGHQHASTAVSFLIFCVAVSVGYGAWSLASAMRPHGRFSRLAKLEIGAMGVSTAVMGAALIL